jgi:hypothetical protein
MGYRRKKEPPRVFLMPSQDFEDYESGFCMAYARMINGLDISQLEPFLEENTVYESQMVFTPLRGRHEILGYLRGKLIAMSKLDPANQPKGEMAFMNDTYVGRPCVILHQGGKEVGLVLCKVAKGKLLRIDLTILPGPRSAEGTGRFPE